jgi:hypothetical protein
VVRVHQVDPRDIRWEVDHPSYRVYFWHQPSPDPADSMWHSDEWEIGGADVDQVLTWASDHAAGRRYVIYVRVDDRDGLGLVRLLGTDPTEQSCGHVSPSLEGA